MAVFCARVQIGLNLLQKSISCEVIATQVRGVKNLNRPKQRYPTWFLKKERVQYQDDVTPENSAFIKDIVQDKYGPPAVISGISTYQQSPLKIEPLKRGTWSVNCKRTGLIARKIGFYPLWLKDGKKIETTLLQVVDNHVIRYTPPEEYVAAFPSKKRRVNKLGCLVVGAESVDPQLFTKEYCGLFNGSGVMPKRVLGRFMVSTESAVQAGTPLYASHFRVGDYVDVRGKTVDRGFQGVMKRWGFHGMPASHGVTKTHRRGGNIGAGGQKARVWPGTKMPGHMGNRYRVLRGLKIWRINTKYNVIWVQGPVAGETNSIVYIYDTILPLRKLKETPPFPTYFPEDQDQPLPDEMYDEKLHPFAAPTITYSESK